MKLSPSYIKTSFGLLFKVAATEGLLNGEKFITQRLRSVKGSRLFLLQEIAVRTLMACGTNTDKNHRKSFILEFN
jgi:hypothetical protein